MVKVKGMDIITVNYRINGQV